MQCALRIKYKRATGLARERFNRGPVIDHLARGSNKAALADDKHGPRQVSAIAVSHQPDGRTLFDVPRACSVGRLPKGSTGSEIRRGSAPWRQKEHCREVPVCSDHPNG